MCLLQTLWYPGGRPATSAVLCVLDAFEYAFDLESFVTGQRAVLESLTTTLRGLKVGGIAESDLTR